MSEYSKFLKHLGINKDLMLSDMQSKLPDCEKPVFIKDVRFLKLVKAENITVAKAVTSGIICMTLKPCRSGVRNTVRILCSSQ